MDDFISFVFGIVLVFGVFYIIVDSKNEIIKEENKQINSCVEYVKQYNHLPDECVKYRSDIINFIEEEEKFNNLIRKNEVLNEKNN